MEQRFRDLRCKEVINVCDGCRLGYVCDIVVQLPLGHLAAIIVPGPARVWGLLGRECDFVIPWPSIRRIGDDIILVDVVLEHIRCPRERKPFF